MRPLGVGIIGAGVGGAQARGFLADRRVGKVVLCDVAADRLAERAGELGIEETTTDWHQIVSRDDVDLVSVASPDHLHAEMAVAALEAGKHVLCEKPMTGTLAEARQVIGAVERSGRKLMVNNVLRFFPRFQHVKRMVDSGELGRIYAAEGDYLHNIVDLIRDGWRGPHRHSAATGSGVHMIDLLRWIVGDVAEAFCYGTRGILTEGQAQSPDCMLAVLKFENGAIAKSMTNLAVQRPALHHLVLYGTEGVFVNDRPFGRLYRGPARESEPVATPYESVGRSAGQKAAAVGHLLDCIERDEPPLVDVYEGARAIAVCDAIFNSYKMGEPVRVEAV